VDDERALVTRARQSATFRREFVALEATEPIDSEATEATERFYSEATEGTQ